MFFTILVLFVFLGLMFFIGYYYDSFERIKEYLRFRRKSYKKENKINQVLSEIKKEDPSLKLEKINYNSEEASKN